MLLLVERSPVSLCSVSLRISDEAVDAVAVRRAGHGSQWTFTSEGCGSDLLARQRPSAACFSYVRAIDLDLLRVFGDFLVAPQTCLLTTGPDLGFGNLPRGAFSTNIWK